MSKYSFRFSKLRGDIEDAQSLRGRVFRQGLCDKDGIDARAEHGLVHDQSGRLVCTFRMLNLEGEELDQCYSANFYDLRGLKAQSLKALEIGRFCIDPEFQDHDIVRLAWAEITRYVYENNIDLLFGCSSFDGVDANRHAEALTLLKDRHLAPKNVMPRRKAQKVFRFATKLRGRKVNLKAAQLAMPPLLRSYLMMGGWVSDHAVVDEDLNTVHVFTGVEVKNIPAGRLKIFDNLMAQI